MIQKFAHFVFDQNGKQIEHVGGYLRYFLLNDCDATFLKVATGRDVFALADKAFKESERQENKQPLSGGQWGDRSIILISGDGFFGASRHVLNSKCLCLPTVAC